MSSQQSAISRQFAGVDRNVKKRIGWLTVSWLLIADCWLLSVAWAAQERPSLFRGVVVADHALGARVVSVEANSQLSAVGLRPEDLIVQIDGQPVTAIDEFAVMSHAYKDRRAQEATVLVLRNGQPHQLWVHLYSVPILRQWNLRFVPEHDLRFIEPTAGAAYWARMGRGFREARNSEAALEAYLNALHHDPTHLEAALATAELLWEVAWRRLEDDRFAHALTSMQQATAFLERLFDQPLTIEQLAAVNEQMRATLAALRRYDPKRS